MTTTADETFDPDIAIPSTISCIKFHAEQNPQKLAVIDNAQEITYSTFYTDIGKMVKALRSLDLKPGDTAAVEVRTLYRHWLVLLAFETLGVITMSYTAGEAAILSDTLKSMDLVLYCPESIPPNANHTQVMDQDWISMVLANRQEAPHDSPEIALETPLNIVKSSGTSGQLKTMIRNARSFAFRIKQCKYCVGYNRSSRHLVAMGFNIQFFHTNASACIRMGGTCITDERISFAEALIKHRITSVNFLPHTLLQVMDNLPKDYAKPENLTISTTGGAISRVLRDRVKRELADTLTESYATNEVSTICLMNQDGIGIIAPGVRAEVVNAKGQSVFGEHGRLRVMSEGMVDGYLNDPQATKRMFRDGWFYPGDLAIMADDQTLKLVGRVDDLLNIRGVKLDPHTLEESLLKALPVSDICMITMADGDDANRVFVVVVLDGRTRLKEFKEQITPLLPPMIGNFKLACITAMPRTDTGKIQRHKLAALITRAVETNEDGHTENTPTTSISFY